MASFLAIWESIVADLINSGANLDTDPYTPAVVTKYMLPLSSSLGTRSTQKTFVSQLEIDAIFSGPLAVLALPISFTPGVGSTLGTAIAGTALTVPAPPPSDNKNISGDGSPPPYLLRPPSLGLTLPAIVGAAIDTIIPTFPPRVPPVPSPFMPPPADLTGTITAALVMTGWLAGTPLFSASRIPPFGNVMGAVNDATWIRLLASSFLGL